MLDVVSPVAQEAENTADANSIISLYPQLLSAAVTHEHLGDREHPLGDIAAHVLEFLAVWVDVICLSDMLRQMSLLMVIGMGELVSAAGLGYDHHALPYLLIREGQPRVQLARTEIPTSHSVLPSCTSYLSQVMQNVVHPVAIDRIEHPAVPPVSRQIYVLHYHATADLPKG